jgi:ribonucleoside-diphosphate reductase alpha chain
MDGPNSPPVEVFMIPSENNSCIRAGAEMTGRLISTALRSGVDVQAIVDQLKGIDCGHAVWVDGELVTSVYDALARTLEALGPTGVTPATRTLDLLTAERMICPKCGQLAAVERGGCLTCLACGNTSCE